MTDTAEETTTAPRRGPGRPAVARQTSLTVEDILDATEKIIGIEGLDALTMQRLAKELGVTVKALYNHVASKASLLQLLVDRIWQREVVLDMPSDRAGLVEWLIEFQLLTRRVWLEHLDLATLAMAVSEPDQILLAVASVSAMVLTDVGVEDVGLVYNALQTFTMGSIAVAANRRRSSAYFGRDPQDALARAFELADGNGLSPQARAVIEAQWDEGDERHFETGLRIIVAALLREASATAGNGASASR
jgi:AcrR family transcriptional regulator